MNKSKVVKDLHTAILLTITVVILLIIFLIVFTIVKNKLFAGETIDTTLIFLAILPFIIYLAVSGKILEFKGGGFELKFNNASNAEILFKSEEVVFAEPDVAVKGDIDRLTSYILPEIAKDPISTLSLVPGRGEYSYEGLKEYLKELTKFDFFKHVLFVDEDKTFKGYMRARNLLDQLLDEGKEGEIINKINNGNIEDIIGYKMDYIKDYTSNREALRIMENEGIADVAVVDKDMKFKGFTNQDMITTRIINNLMTKAM